MSLISKSISLSHEFQRKITETINNADVNLTLELVPIPGTDNGRGYGFDHTTEFVDVAGNRYNEKGELIKAVNPTSGTTADAISNVRAQRLKKYGRRKQGGVLRFPAESLTQHTDYLQIDIERYAEIGSCLLYTSPSPRDRG